MNGEEVKRLLGEGVSGRRAPDMTKPEIGRAHV